MSRLQKLKEQNTKFDISFLDVLKFLDCSNKNTYLEFLLKIIKNNYGKEHSRNIRYEVSEVLGIEIENLKHYEDFEINFLFNVASHFFSFSDLNLLRKFHKLRDEGKIYGVDISKFNSFEDIRDQINIYEIKSFGLDLDKMSIKDFEDQEWLIVRPLTHLASKRYGSNTKWCTTSEHSDNFDRYSKKGILIYTLNKLSGYKVATFYSLDPNDKELSFWDQLDRRIDSMETELPSSIIEIIRSIIKKENQTNYDNLDMDYRFDQLQNKLKKLTNLRCETPATLTVIETSSSISTSDNLTYSVSGYDWFS